MQRIDQFSTTPLDTAVYDHFGNLLADIDAGTGLAFPQNDPIGHYSQGDFLADEETP